MSKVKAIVILCIVAILFITLVLFTVPLNGNKTVQIGDSDKDFSWIFYGIDLGIDLQGGIYAEYQVYFEDGREVTDDDIKGAMSNLSDILLDKGYSEASIDKVTKAGNSYIRVEVAGLEDTASLLDLIGDSATLTFRNESGEIVMTGTGMIDTCQISVDDENSSYYSIVIKFNDAGTKKFAEITETYKDKPLSIYIDDTLLMSPTVNAVITNGVASITGKFDYQTAYEYQVKIQAGITETKLKLISCETISASLGSEALFYSLLAAAIGLGLIIIFLIVIYRGFGLAASCALLIYTELLICGLALIPWVELTLSGIAGVILSIGMAVDANVIIFERIREIKFVGNKSIPSAISTGFKSAFITILDANITTVIGSIVMIIFGSSSVKSFAITLLIGIILSMFTAIVVTRLFINCFLAFDDENLAFYNLKKPKSLEKSTESTVDVEA